MEECGEPENHNHEEGIRGSEPTPFDGRVLVQLPLWINRYDRESSGHDTRIGQCTGDGIFAII